MEGIDYVVGSKEISNIPMQPYSDETCDFLAALSAAIIKSGLARLHPDVSAFAFWCRRANIQRLKANVKDIACRLGRGLCFHIAPSNIPVNFAFSWAFSLLAGNANIVRLPSRKFPQAEAVCEAVRQTISNYPEIQKSTAFIRYPADNSITAAFCSIADARMIWGGDETVSSIKKLPVKPRCIDITFADRYSICIINGQAVRDANDAKIFRLAEDFYNDTYLMDQNACSSPQMILWQNDEGTARARFWDAVFSYASKRYELQASVAVDKYVKLCEDVLNMDWLASAKRSGNLVYRVELKGLMNDTENPRGNSGYFYEYSLTDIKELSKIVTDKYQTLSQFGVDENDLRSFVIDNRLRGIDRIVPVGKAMDINVIWDGIDLIDILSRIVDIG